MAAGGKRKREEESWNSDILDEDFGEDRALHETVGDYDSDEDSDYTDQESEHGGGDCVKEEEEDSVSESEEEEEEGDCVIEEEEREEDSDEEKDGYYFDVIADDVLNYNNELPSNYGTFREDENEDQDENEDESDKELQEEESENPDPSNIYGTYECTDQVQVGSMGETKRSPDTM